MDKSILYQCISLILALLISIILAIIFLNIGKSGAERFNENKQRSNVLSRQAMEDKDYVARRLNGILQSDSPSHRAYSEDFSIDPYEHSQQLA